MVIGHSIFLERINIKKGFLKAIIQISTVQKLKQDFQAN